MAGSGANESSNNYNNLNILKTNDGSNNSNITGDFSNLKDDSNNNKPES